MQYFFAMILIAFIIIMKVCRQMNLEKEDTMKILLVFIFTIICVVSCDNESKENFFEGNDFDDQFSDDHQNAVDNDPGTNDDINTEKPDENTYETVDELSDEYSDDSTDEFTDTEDEEKEDNNEDKTDTDQEIPDENEIELPTSCNFTYESEFIHTPLFYTMPDKLETSNIEPPSMLEIAISHSEPKPPYTYTQYLKNIMKSITMPGYNDNMPLFDRADQWLGAKRCYEFGGYAHELSQSEAYDLYREIIKKTLGRDIDTTPGTRTVLGLRGAYPGTFKWHNNYPDRFNDTIVLLWTSVEYGKHAREFPASLDTGAYAHSSMSSLLPNRMYRYINGWHSGYNALQISEPISYRTADDANKNGHWDNDRNGWLNYSASAIDFIRIGGAHNIHLASVNAPLGTAKVGVWSAGCQVIPGRTNWDEFINNAWTGLNDIVEYYLVDVRDINDSVWEEPPCTEDGSRECPFKIKSFPYTHSADTSLSPWSEFDIYGCNAADESGPEYVYELTVNKYGKLNVSVDCDDPVDIDIHLLSMDDRNACLTRAHISFSWDIAPGRYLIVADTFENFSGHYTLNVSFE
jgi:hypothetical protein